VVRIPKELSGETKKFVSFGKTEKFYVDPKEPKAVREMKKQLMLYRTTKKTIVTKFFPVISRFMGYKMLNTTASLIHEGGNTKLFDFGKKTVTTVFESKEVMSKNLSWMKKLAPRTNVPKVLAHDPNEKTVTTRYIDFELLQPKNFRIYVDEVIGINDKLGKRKKKVRMKDFLKTLPENQRTLAKKRLDALELPDKRIGVTTSHGDFHPGNLPRYGMRFYLLDFDSIGLAPRIFDFAYFSFIPAHFNMSYAETGVRLFRKFLEKIEPSPAELAVSLSMVRSTDIKLQSLFEENGLFIET
jgi:thiamine kinase-like enzyme